MTYCSVHLIIVVCITLFIAQGFYCQSENYWYYNKWMYTCMRCIWRFYYALYKTLQQQKHFLVQLNGNLCCVKYKICQCWPLLKMLVAVGPYWSFWAECAASFSQLLCQPKSFHVVPQQACIEGAMTLPMFLSDSKYFSCAQVSCKI